MSDKPKGQESKNPAQQGVQAAINAAMFAIQEGSSEKTGNKAR